MTKEQIKLWNKIKQFEFDDLSSSLTFSERLSRENGWKLEFSIRCIEEYKKFMFLICISNHPLTPSDEVDQVWHLHLLYTDSYWNKFCSETLNRQVHHGPTKGGEKEGMKFENWYERTKELYTQVFQQIPPKDIWKPSDIRFREINFQRVSMDNYWIFRKPKLFKK